MKEKIAFVYSGNVARFLIKDCGLTPITQAINPNNMKKFTMFERTPEFRAGMDKYEEIRKAN
ncbi:hypothetical protein CHH48_07275 [Terribacillus saccharophilus]|uniref:Uncharacterized protein n=2 Tax=Terribacillus saccharophilus TaxID=361277 RepID=A0ABX4H0A1_9BACI|nr:hypothetical protein CHH56_05940 [Terribacillus saccharophilus]PAD96985.1 hypothetical protein CHH50_06370 [Terribacillus saccharophilus]PAE00561.1 hypothetical protein CHH48_07275 [Terribacillus saccharophilus]